MANRQMPPADFLRQVLEYDPETGFLYWRERSVSMFKQDGARPVDHVARTWNTRYAGRRALYTPNNRGHMFGLICGKPFQTHRVVWTIFYGVEPRGQIDHINGNGYDNRIANLRDVSHTENSRNQSLHKNNTSGQSGVNWMAKDKRWRARITVDYKVVYLGYFVSKEDAIRARLDAEKQYGFHPNHGRRASQCTR